KINLQHALIIVGAHLLGIYETRQRERASEASVLSLDATVVFLFLFLLQLTLAVYGEGVVLNANINVSLVDARDFNLQGDVVLVFVDVHWRRKTGGRQRLLRARRWAVQLTEKTVHLVLQCGGATERILNGSILS